MNNQDRVIKTSNSIFTSQSQVNRRRVINACINTVLVLEGKLIKVP